MVSITEASYKFTFQLNFFCVSSMFCIQVENMSCTCCALRVREHNTAPELQQRHSYCGPQRVLKAGCNENSWPSCAKLALWLSPVPHAHMHSLAHPLTPPASDAHVLLESRQLEGGQGSTSSAPNAD